MAKSSPIRIDQDIHSYATTTAQLMSRSASQQVSHWARIGRELEISRNISLRAIEQVLDCETSYDDLNDYEQAVLRAEWAERTEQRRQNLNFEREFTEAGRSYVELGDDGNIVRHQP